MTADAYQEKDIVEVISDYSAASGLSSSWKKKVHLPKIT
jgi:hypothetical protein